MMMHLRSLPLPAGASLLRRHALAAVAAAPVTPCWTAATPAPAAFRLFRRRNHSASSSSGSGSGGGSGGSGNGSSSRGGDDSGPVMIPYRPDPLHALQRAAAGGGQAAAAAGAAPDGLPDLYRLPDDEDPAVTAARVLVRDDLHRERQRKQIIEHFSIVIGGLALLAAYAVYVYKTEGRMIVANPFTTVIPPIPVHLPPIDPSAEDGPLWSALVSAMPTLRPVPELEAQWKLARKEKKRQKRLEKEAEILYWGGYIKEKPKKEKKAKNEQTDENKEHTEQTEQKQ